MTDEQLKVLNVTLQGMAKVLAKIENSVRELAAIARETHPEAAAKFQEQERKRRQGIRE